MNFFVNKKSNKLLKAMLQKKIEIFFQYLMNIPLTELLFFETFPAACLQCYVKRTPSMLFVLEL